MDTLAIIKLIELRLVEIGMDKKEFYEKSGVSSASYSQWKTGKYNPSKKAITKIAKCLGLSVDQLAMPGSPENPIRFTVPIEEAAGAVRSMLTGEEKEKAPSDEGESQDPDIRRIERARKSMSETDKKKMMNILKASFEDYFSDDYKDDDINE